MRTIKISDVIDNVPAAIISVMPPNGKRGRKCVARLDTGSDVTCVPWWSVQDLYLPVDRYVHLRMSNGLYCSARSKRGSIEIWDGEDIFGLFHAKTGIIVSRNIELGLLGMDILRYLWLKGHGNQWALSFPNEVNHAKCNSSR